MSIHPSVCPPLLPSQFLPLSKMKKWKYYFQCKLHHLGSWYCLQTDLFHQLVTSTTFSIFLSTSAIVTKTTNTNKVLTFFTHPTPTFLLASKVSSILQFNIIQILPSAIRCNDFNQVLSCPNRKLIFHFNSRSIKIMVENHDYLLSLFLSQRQIITSDLKAHLMIHSWLKDLDFMEVTLNQNLNLF